MVCQTAIIFFSIGLKKESSQPVVEFRELLAFAGQLLVFIWELQKLPTSDLPWCMRLHYSQASAWRLDAKALGKRAASWAQRAHAAAAKFALSHSISGPPCCISNTSCRTLWAPRFDMFVAAAGWHLCYFSSAEHGQFKRPNKPKMDTPFLESNTLGSTSWTGSSYFWSATFITTLTMTQKSIKRIKTYIYAIQKKTLTKKDTQLSMYFGLRWVRCSRQTSEYKHMLGRWHCVAGTGSAGALSCISKTPKPFRNAHGGPRIRAGGVSGYGGLRPSSAVRKSRALGPVNWQALQEPGKCRSNSTQLSAGLCQFYQ